MSYPMIMNGDHAEFEREHANTKPEDRPDWPLPSFDARDWAKAFCRRFMVTTIAGYDSARVDDDEGLMTGWFANALMRGFDEAGSRMQWRAIDTAPKDEEVLLGWWSTWPELFWETAAGLAGSTKGGWLHGQATHWMPLPAPPSRVQAVGE